MNVTSVPHLLAIAHGGVLLDPCLGLGKSASIFADAGMRVVGSEINHDRFRRAAERLGMTPC